MTSPAAAGRPLFPPEDRHKVFALATQRPADLGLPQSHWSLDDLALHICQEAHYRDMSRSTIARLLSEAELRPHRSHYWLTSHDPDFEQKMLDVCRLYLDAPRLVRHGELVLCVDEKTGMQALERVDPTRPVGPGRPERRSHEYVRHGTRCLLASLVVTTGRVHGTVTARRTSRDFCRHLAAVADLYAGAKRVHWVMDNLNTHWSLDLCRLFARLSGVRCPVSKLKRGRDRKAFLTDPGHRHVVHFTPTHGSWLNQIEIWFGVLVRRVLRRGEFRSREELTRKVLDYIDHYNAHLAHPYRWTFTGKPLTA